MMIYAVPLSPGFSRLMFCVATTRKSPMLRLLGLIPRWVQHLPRMEVLAGDGIFLHAQERELRRYAPSRTPPDTAGPHLMWLVAACACA